MNFKLAAPTWLVLGGYVGKNNQNSATNSPRALAARTRIAPLAARARAARTRWSHASSSVPDGSAFFFSPLWPPYNLQPEFISMEAHAKHLFFFNSKEVQRWQF